MVHIPTRDLKPHEGRVKDFLESEGYCVGKLTPDCVQDAINDLSDEYESRCESPDENKECERMFDMLAALERTKLFLEKYAKR
jgi:hypothetical protein